MSRYRASSLSSSAGLNRVTGTDCGIAPGIARPLSVFLHHVEQARAGAADRAPAVAIPDGAACGLRKAAADQDRRIGFLYRLGPGHHLRKIDHVAMILGLGFGPDLLHRLDPLAHQLEAAFEHCAVVLHLVLVPAT